MLTLAEREIVKQSTKGKVIKLSSLQAYRNRQRIMADQYRFHRRDKGPRVA